MGRGVNTATGKLQVAILKALKAEGAVSSSRELVDRLEKRGHEFIQGNKTAAVAYVLSGVPAQKKSIAHSLEKLGLVDVVYRTRGNGTKVLTWAGITAKGREWLDDKTAPTTPTPVSVSAPGPHKVTYEPATSTATEFSPSLVVAAGTALLRELDDLRRTVEFQQRQLEIEVEAARVDPSRFLYIGHLPEADKASIRALVGTPKQESA